MRAGHLAISCVVATASLQHFALADVLYSTGFEPPRFVPGLLAGQDGWFAALGADSGTISTELPWEGQQGVRIDGAELEEFFGFFFGSFARELSYDPMGSGTPVVMVSARMRLSAEDPTCGNAFGVTGLIPLQGELVPNALIGVQERGGQLVSYLSNYDGVLVIGPPYQVGEWARVRAAFDYETRTVRGFFNGQFIGEVPFTSNIDDKIYYINMSLGSSEPIPDVIAYGDNLLVEAIGPDCYADFNGDGVVDTRDVLAFLNVWSSGGLEADCDDNTVIDTRDVLCFLNLWSAGC